MTAAQDSETRSEVFLLRMHDDFDELEARLRHRMAFGTAGLRARMGAGYSRMNCLTVIQTSNGLADYILELADHDVKSRDSPPGFQPTAVIGYDIRKNSKRFAELAAVTFLKKGFKVLFFRDYVHTPLVPFGVKFAHAAVGVMITASHNPACDNGYKVYLGPSGCQINSPHDTEIAKLIVKLENLTKVSWMESEITELPAHPHFTFFAAGVFDAYYRALCDLTAPLSDVQESPRYVYTPIHGTGHKYLRHVVERMGLSHVISVVEAQVRSIRAAVPLAADRDDLS